MTPWYVKSFGSTSHRSYIGVKAGGATGGVGVGAGIKAGGGTFDSNIIIRISAIRAVCFLFKSALSAACFFLFRPFEPHVRSTFVQ